MFPIIIMILMRASAHMHGFMQWYTPVSCNKQLHVTALTESVNVSLGCMPSTWLRLLLALEGPSAPLQNKGRDTPYRFVACNKQQNCHTGVYRCLIRMHGLSVILGGIAQQSSVIIIDLSQLTCLSFPLIMTRCVIFFPER